jgi:uncharacterized surface protein with fasciclin (FAS1) repeats
MPNADSVLDASATTFHKPFTVFAPTGEAFARLPEGTPENLLKPDNKSQLQGILTYHVLPGGIMSADAAMVSSYHPQGRVLSNPNVA